MCEGKTKRESSGYTATFFRAAQASFRSISSKHGLNEFADKKTLFTSKSMGLVLFAESDGCPSVLCTGNSISNDERIKFTSAVIKHTRQQSEVLTSESLCVGDDKCETIHSLVVEVPSRIFKAWGHVQTPFRMIPQNRIDDRRRQLRVSPWSFVPMVFRPHSLSSP